jgi:vacuolar-type H+-ATPase subunit I/STV1
MESLRSQILSFDSGAESVTEDNIPLRPSSHDNERSRVNSGLSKKKGKGKPTGMTPSGSRSFVNMKTTDYEETVEIDARDKFSLEITSHKEKLKGYKNLDELEIHNKLKKQF